MPEPTLPALSVDERSRVRHHMGYPQMQQVSTFELGTPASIQTDFLIERAMDLVNRDLGGLARVREYLCKLDEIECAMQEGLEDYGLIQFETIQINQKAQEQRQNLYDYWLTKLSNALAVPPNPLRFQAGGGLNVRVG